MPPAAAASLPCSHSLSSPRRDCTRTTQLVEGEAPGGVAEALRFVDDAVFSFLLLLLVSGATTALGFFTSAGD
ncbi:unnamed protein product [Linum tenue]|uniref:Uncharacterized protein n=1 Tax=Linum tenue TaxID=586396 RepID=A0AAV0R2D9_9ROSI|nr:unnamed protein product [Linum tenue]